MAWSEELKPSDWSQIVGNDEARQEFLEWLTDWNPRQRKKAAILHGPAGVGKTITVELGAKKLNYNVVELNASDVRTREKLAEVLFPAMRSTALTGKRNLILLDEIDGLSHRKDAGGTAAIAHMIDNAATPIVMTANDPWGQSLREIRDRSELFELRKLRSESILRNLRKIAEQRGIIVEQGALEIISEKADGDMRSALMDLQSLGSETKVLKQTTVREVLQDRMREENVFQGIRNALSTSDPLQARRHLSSIDVMPDELTDWIYGNATNICTGAKPLFTLMKAVSEADYLHAVMWKNRNWMFIPYIYDILSLGLTAASNKKGWVRLNMPRRISQKWVRLGKVRRNREMANQLKKEVHERTSILMTQILPLLNYLGNRSASHRKR